MPAVRLLSGLLVLVLLAGAGACGDGVDAQAPADLVLGVGSTTEQAVLAALTVVALEQAGVQDVVVRTDLGATVSLRQEAQRGAVDLYWDYTGAAWALGLRQQAPPAAEEESWERVHQADLEHGLTWLPPTRANATLALFVRAADLPPEGQPRGLEWLAGVLSGGEVVLCADPDFLDRPAGYAALASAYAIDRGRLRLRRASEEQAIAGVADGTCFAGLATATSGAASAAGLVPVADDLGVFPAFVVAPVARTELLAARPEVAEALARVTARLDTRALAELSAAAELGQDPSALAQAFLAVDEPSPSDG